MTIRNTSFTSPTNDQSNNNIVAVQAQIAALEAQLKSPVVTGVNAEDVQIRTLQDSKRVKKKYTNKVSDLILENEQRIKNEIVTLNRVLAQLLADRDNSFGAKTTQSLPVVNDEYQTQQEEQIKQDDIDEYTRIFNQFNDSTFDVTQAISNLNSTYNKDNDMTPSVRNTYHEDTFDDWSTGEKSIVQNMVSETINNNGMTVRYLPRASDYHDYVWNEEPSSYYHSGFMVDMFLRSATGFEGEGRTLTQYGIEFKEEVLLSVSIPRFDELMETYRSTLSEEESGKFSRTRPLEGDLIVIPFGKTASNKDSYIPKFFEILHVTTFQDGNFFQVGDNYQHKLNCRLFEMSGEDIAFAPTITREEYGTSVTYEGPNTGYIYKSNQNNDSENFIAGDMIDPYARNLEIERAAQNTATNRQSPKQAGVIVDKTAQQFKIDTLYDSLDDI